MFMKFKKMNIFKRKNSINQKRERRGKGMKTIRSVKCGSTKPRDENVQLSVLCYYMKQLGGRGYADNLFSAGKL